MNLRFSSAGSIRFSRQIFFLLLILFSVHAGCTEKPNNDSQIAELQKEVKQLTEDNRKLLKEVQSLREEINLWRTDVTPATAPEPQTEPVEQMTVDRMKAGVEPLLKEVIEKLKKTAETPRKDRQYGMRIEYDLKNAVYGLNNQNGPSAKVIVKYEKFLESGQDSRSIGVGNSTFMFAYQVDRWVLLSFE